MKIIIRTLFLLLFLVASICYRTNAQCSPNNIEFLSVQKIYNTACGDNSYQVIRGENLIRSGQTFQWEVSFSGLAFKTVVDANNVPISTEDLSKNDITNHILLPNSSESGDYRIRRIVTDTAPACSSISEPVFLYYSQNQASLSGGTISGLNTSSCAPASGSLLVTGNTGPVLQWESAPAGTENWTAINQTTNTLVYSGLSESTCYRVLIDNICTGSPGVIDASDKYSTTFCVTVNSVPVVTGPINQTICQGNTFNLSVTVNSVSSPTYQWRKDGVAISGANAPSYSVAAANFSDAGVYDVQVSNTCGTVLSTNATVTISLPPAVTVPANFSSCAGTTIPASNFISNPTGATYTWTNSNPTIGLPASGTGNLPAFTAINTGTTNLSATITVTPLLNGCTGPTSSYTITVLPLPVMIAPANSTSCAGATIASTSFSSTPAGVNYSWTNSNTAIGLAASGTENVPSFTSSNTTTAPISATITVTPSLNGCPGNAITYTITVNPLPVISSATAISESVCDASDGTITIIATGVAPLEYSINGGSSFQNGGIFNGLAAGSYSVVVRNASGCITVGPTLSVSSPGAPPTPELNAAISTICQRGTISISVANPNPLATYSWTGPLGFTANGSSITRTNATTAMSGNYAVTASIGSCVSTAKIFSMTVAPLPLVTVPQNMTYCAGAPIPAGSFTSTPAGATFSWTNSNTNIGLAASGIGDIPTFTAINPGTNPITATITVTPVLNGCTGATASYTITINPIPVVNLPSNLVVCSGSAVPSAVLTSIPANATFSWSNSNSAIGLPASGTGNIPSFTAINTGATPISATITVTPTINGCSGPSRTYTITVDPLPIVTVPVSFNVCSGSSIPASNFFSNPTGATYTWTNSNTAIGLIDNGTGNLPAFTAINTGTTNLSATITVTPLLNGCAGPTSSYTITVLPLPVMIAPANSTSCAGATIASTSFSSTPAGVTYSWTNSNTAIGLAASGTGNVPSFTSSNNTTAPISATITVTPSLNGCSGNAITYIITVNPLPTINGPGNITVCAETTIPVSNLTSNLTGTTYTWTNSNSAIGLPSSGTGNIPAFIALNTTISTISAIITVTPTINGCSGSSISYTISVNPLPKIIKAIATDESKCDIKDGTITITANGSQPLEFSINGGISFVSNGGNFTGLASGSYSVMVRNQTGCMITGPVLSVSSPGAPPQPQINALLSPVCQGEPIILSILNPDPLATYTWTGPLGFNATGASILRSNSDLSMSGTYAVTATVNSCMNIAKTINLIVSPQPTISVPANLIYCEGSIVPQTSFNSNPSGASISWSNSNPGIGLAANGNGIIPSFTAVNNSNLPITATITIIPTLNNCIGAAYSFNITINPSPIVSVPANFNVCAGATVSSTSFTSSLPGTVLSWTNTNPAIGLPASGTGNIPTFIATNSSATGITAIITVTPTLNGCEGPSSSYVITANPIPSIISTNVTNETVCNANNGTISINASGIQPLEYSIDGGSTFFQNGGNFTGLAAGSYSVEVRNASGCLVIGPILSIISPGAPPQPTVNPFISPICQGDPLILSIQNPDPLATYQWTGPKGFTGSGPSITRINSDPTMSGLYAVTAKINSCVSASKIFNLTVNPLPTLIVPQNIISCEGSLIPETIFNSTPPGATISWTNSNPGIGLAASGTTKIPGFTAINNTGVPIIATITLTATLNNCVGPSSSYTITVNPTPTAVTPGNLTVCAETEVPLTNFISNTSGTTFIWTNSNSSIGLEASGSGSLPAFKAVNNTTSAKTAIITVTPILNGCTGPSSTYTITVKPLPKVSNTILTQAICTGSDSKEVLITSNIPGTIFSWTATSSPNLKGYLSSGTNTIPVQSIINNSTDEGVVTYTITPFINGCEGTASIYTIEVHPLPTATLSGGKTVCYGSTTSLSVQLTGTAPWSISYTDGTATQTIRGIGTNNYTFNVTSNITKTYSITSVSDANSCSNTGTGNAIVVQPISPVIASASSINVSCFGAKNGSIKVETVSGGFGNYEFSLDLGKNWQNGITFSGLSIGNYQLYVRDTDHPECITVVSPEIKISQPSTPLNLTFIRSDVSCFGGQNGSLKIAAAGGTAPYSYQWSNGATSNEISDLKAGTYTITLTDSNGCKLTESISIREPNEPLKISFVKTDATCFGSSNGSINISVSGGTLPYTYTWSNNEITEDLNNLTPNTAYTITVLDVNGCSQTQRIIIDQPEILKASLTVKNTTCKTSIDGMITASVIGGTKPYTFKWTGLPLTESRLNNLAPGRYELLVTDINGCSTLVSAELLAGNCAPIAIDDYFKTDEEIKISGNVALNDFDRQNEPISFILTSNPKNGTITFGANGEFVYTPNVGFWGIENINYRVCNTSGMCATAILNIEVFPFTMVSLTPSISTVNEGKKTTVTARLLRPFKDDVNIRVAYRGRAAKNRDYVLLDQYQDIRIPRGKISTTEKITLAALTDYEQEGDEDVIVDIISSSDPLVRIGSGAVVIISDIYPPEASKPVTVQNEAPINPDIKPDPLISPNNDGLGNEFFKIENIVSFPDNLVLIFNRWGNEVFRLEGYNESDRVFKGYANTGILTNTNTPLTDGVYYYLITTNRLLNGMNITGLNKGYLILKR